MPKQKKKKRVIIYAILIGILFVVPIGVYSYQHSQKNQVVKAIAFINGEPISENEFDLFFSRQRANVYSYFHSTYSVSEEDDFWHTSYNGKIPIVTAKELTLEILKKVKLEQQLMKENGILQDATYNTFLMNLETENKRRQEALDNNQVIYGPKQYQENTYYDYLHSNRLIALKEVMGEKIFHASDDKLEVYYHESKDQYPDYKKQDYIRTQCIKVPYVQNGKSIMSQNDALSRINEAKEQLKTSSFEDVLKKYNEHQEPVEIIFDHTTARQNIKYESELYMPVSELEVEDISQVIHFNGAYYIIKCVERINGGYQDFNDYEDIIKDRYIEALYAEYVESLMKDATVDIIEKVYNAFE